MDNRGPGLDAAFVALQPTPRRVLGDVSPNVRTMTVHKTSNDKILHGSPLKRNSSAALNDGTGFTYLKRRKLSTDKSVPPEDKSWHKQTLPLEIPRVNAPLSTFSPQIDTKPNLLPAVTPARSIEDGEDEDSVAERRSFSSLINYEPSSQNATSSQAQPKSLFKGPSYAEILKLRLQVAMYKIKTNQTDVPFDELREHKATPQQSNYAEAEQAVVALRAEAHLRELQRSHAHPRAAPMSQAFMSHPGDVYARDLLYSPPAATSFRLQGFITPASLHRPCIPEDEVTSSIVKDSVVESLLHLRRGV